MLRACVQLVLAAVWTTSCGESGFHPGYDVTNPALRPAQAPGHQARATAALAVDFNGTCSWGRAPGDPTRYELTLRARQDPSGAVLIRRDAWFDLDDDRNLLGELPSGTVVRGDGPVAAPGSPHGAGYGVLVRGHTGRVCRGYVSETYVEVVRARARRSAGP